MDWSLAANFNTTRVTRVSVNAEGEPILNAQQIDYLTSTAPNNKEILGGTWQLGKWGASVHETHWGATTDQLSYNVGPESIVGGAFYLWRNKAIFTTDLEVHYDIIQNLQVAIGANNLFDRYPSRIPFVTALEGQLYDAQSSQAGYDGGYYYLRLSYRWL